MVDSDFADSCACDAFVLVFAFGLCWSALMRFGCVLLCGWFVVYVPV